MGLNNQTPAAREVGVNEGVYVIQADDTVEVITSNNNATFQQLWIYPAKAVAGGVLTANTLGDVYVGRSSTYLPEKRATSDTASSVTYSFPSGQRMKLNAIHVRGKAGDGVFYTYT